MLYQILNNARPILGALGILTAVVGPPFLPLMAMVLLAIRFAAWEIVAIGFLVDLLWRAPFSGGEYAYGGGLEGLIAGLPLFTIIGIVLAWGLEPLRSEFLTR